MSRFDPELLTQLHELNLKREQSNLQNATVTMEELGEADPDAEKPDPDSKEEKELYELAGGLAANDDHKSELREVYDIQEEENALVKDALVPITSSGNL